LSLISANVEEKAVDLYVLEKAFLSTHTENQDDVKALSFWLTI
jgi:Mn2+-dependent serine/threonine protein kinase